MACSVKDCENSASIFFCPNRFSDNEMLDIELALKMTCETMLAIQKRFQKDSILPDSEVTPEELKGKIAELEKLQNKVSNLLA